MCRQVAPARREMIGKSFVFRNDAAKRDLKMQFMPMSKSIEYGQLCSVCSVVE
jgi:hypothetical protein